MGVVYFRQNNEALTSPLNNSTLMLKKIFQTDINFRRLLLRLFLFGGLTCLIMYLLFPIFFWAMYGEGESASRISNTIFTKISWLLSACIVLTPITITKILNNYKRGQLAKSKEYVFISILIVCFSLVLYICANWENFNYRRYSATSVILNTL